MRPGQDTDDFLYIMEISRDRLHDMGDYISPGRLCDHILNTFTPDYNFERSTRFKDSEFGLEDNKSAMPNMYIYLLSRSLSTPSTVGRAVAMQVQDNLSADKCYIGR